MSHTSQISGFQRKIKIKINLSLNLTKFLTNNCNQFFECLVLVWWMFWFYNIFTRRLFALSYMTTILKESKINMASVWKNMLIFLSDFCDLTHEDHWF